MKEKIIRWWMTPKLPPEDIYELPLLIDNSFLYKILHLLSHWIIHPIKRRLARVYLKLLQKYTNIKVIAVTGSSGKSMTVQMISSILGQKGKVVSTPPGIDPVYSIPNTIIKTYPGTNYLILEMSVEYPGEMDYYLWLAKPDIGVILNIYPTHLEFLANVEGVLQEKGKLLLSLDQDSYSVLNSNDKLLNIFAENLKSNLNWFEGSNNPLVEDANAAIEVGKILGLQKNLIDIGLRKFKKPRHRLEIKKLKSGAVLVDDSYNSNPEALRKSLIYFLKLTKKRSRKIVVLGDMLQLGKFEEGQHRLLGKEISNLNLDSVIGVGKASKYMIDEIRKNSKKTDVYHFNNYQQSITLVKRLLQSNTFCLIKGSRSIGLDRLVDMLQ